MFSALPGYEPMSSSGGSPATSVKLLMHFDGPTGSQNFVDSAGGLVFTADDANQTIQPSVAAFGSGGLSLPTANAGISATWPAYLSLAAVFTIEWIWKTGSSPNTSLPTFLSSNNNGAYSDYMFILFAQNGLLQLYGGVFGYSDTRFTFPDFTFAANATYALAVTRDSSNVIRGFCNGLVSTSTYVSNADWTHVGRPLQIGTGTMTPSTVPVNGIDELRITQFCLYTDNYTPATSAFPDP